MKKMKMEVYQTPAENGGTLTTIMVWNITADALKKIMEAASSDIEVQNVQDVTIPEDSDKEAEATKIMQEMATKEPEPVEVDVETVPAESSTRTKMSKEEVGLAIIKEIEKQMLACRTITELKNIAPRMQKLVKEWADQYGEIDDPEFCRDVLFAGKRFIFSRQLAKYADQKGVDSNLKKDDSYNEKVAYLLGIKEDSKEPMDDTKKDEMRILFHDKIEELRNR